MSNFVTHLECSKAGDCYDHKEINNLSKINNPLFVKYDLERLKNSYTREDLIFPSRIFIAKISNIILFDYIFYFPF